MVMDLTWGIELHDVDIDLTETFDGITEMSEIGNFGVKWVQTFEDDDKSFNFGFPNVVGQELNEEDGINILVHNLSDNFAKVFFDLKDQYSEKYGIRTGEINSFHMLSRLAGSKERVTYDGAGQNHNKNVAMRYTSYSQYTGGSIIFPRFGVVVTPKPGQMLIYPANYMYSYVDQEVLSGIKQEVVTWF